MPLPVAHSLVGALSVAFIYPTERSREWFLALFVGAFITNYPDLDFILYWATGTKGWHRGFTHSITFSLLLSLVALIALGRKHLRRVVAFGLAYMSHGLLDFATTVRGGGVQLLWPFSDRRLALRLVGLSEIPLELSPVQILFAVFIEILIFFPLLIAAILIKQRKYLSHILANRQSEN